MSLSQQWLILFALCCLLNLNVHSWGLSQSQVNDLSTFINDAIQCSKAGAASVAIVRDDQIIYNQGFNRISSNSENISDDKTIFCIGELTKAFTATLLGKLLENNNNSYTFDTPIHEILGSDFYLSDPKRSNKMNLRDILTQKTGISNMAAITQMNSIKVEHLMSHLVHAPEAFKFRDRVFHSDLLFFLAEKVVEKLGGKSYEALLSEHILDPLEMTSTSFVHDLRPSKENLAQPSVKINNRQYPVSILSMRGYELTKAANGLCSTANDMSKWLRMNLMNGISSSKRSQIISQETLETLYKLDMDRFTEAYDLIRQRFLQPAVTVSFAREGYGMGWEVGTYRGYKLLTHAGSITGYEAIISMLPEQRVGTFLAMTGTGGCEAIVIKTLISAFVLDLTLNNTSWINYTNVCPVMDNLMADMERNAYLRRPHFTPHIWIEGHSSDIEEDKDDLNLCAGTYQNRMFGNITIDHNATSDQLSMNYGKTGYFKLKRTTTKDTFLMEALGGLPYYINHADNYKSDLYRYLYFNKSKDSSEMDKFESITIPDFDHHVHPVFKRHLDPVTPRPVTQKPVTEKPVTEKPVTKKPVTKKPVTKRPISKKAVTKKPVTKKKEHFSSEVYLMDSGQNIVRAFSILILSCIVNVFFIVAPH